MSSFSGHAHNYNNSPPSIGWKITTTDYVTLSVACVVVLARCYTKFAIVRNRGWDDCACIPIMSEVGGADRKQHVDTIVMALCVAIGRTACDCTLRYRYGGGRHTWDIPPDMLSGYITEFTDPSRKTQMVAIDGYLYVVALTLAKLSLLIFLYRIFRVDKRFRIATWILGVTLTVWAIITVFLAIFACRPVAASWNAKLMLDPKTRCYPKSWNTMNIFGFCNIITDFALIIMPMPLVWRMQMDRKKKVGLVLVFVSGVL
ncbi:MAG: hypothetical protein Q9168_008225 [Polycauliona sp. 1 TL-2023]